MALPMLVRLLLAAAMGVASDLLRTSARVARAAAGPGTASGRAQAGQRPWTWSRRGAAATPLHAADPDAVDEWARAKPFHSIPGPEPVGVVGYLLRSLRRVGQSGKENPLHHNVSLSKKYGNIVRINNIVGHRDMVLLYDPSHVKKLFRSEGPWPMRNNFTSLLYYRSTTRRGKYGGHGLGSSQGKEWHDFRTKVNKHMLQPRSVRRYVGAFNEVADDFIGRMYHLRNEKKELPAGFLNELNKWSLESVAVVALDTRLGCLAPNLAPDSEPQRMIDALQDIWSSFYKMDGRTPLWRFVGAPSWRRVVKAFDYTCDVSEKYVNKSLARNKERTDPDQSILLRLTDVDPKVAQTMAVENLIAGSDTTTVVTAGVLFHLAKNSHVQQRAREEVFKALPRDQSPVTVDTLNQLPYLKACLKESLRMFPSSIGITRQTQTNIVLGGYQIPKGVDVFVCHMAMSRDEKHYPRPLSFEPERWLRGDPNAHTANPFVTLPFGFGPRSCIGRRFAEAEMLTLISKTLRKFRVEFHHGDEIQFAARTTNNITTPLTFRLIDQQ